MTEPIIRSVPFEVVRADATGDGLTIEGYAAVFDTPTRIDNPFEGRFDEQIARGAFDKSINDHAQWPVMMFEHGRHPLVGQLPIGVITQMRSDQRGLFVRGRITDNWLISPVRDAIGAGAVSGMSFRAEPMRERVDTSKNPPLVTRTELRLVELGPVVSPAYETAKVTVRSREIRDALEDPEARSDLAKALLAGMFERQSDREEANLDTPDAADLNAAARRIAADRGWAMDDGSYPIRPLDMHGRADLDKAVNAVGRGNAPHNAIRRHIISRARALGLTEMIPDNWNSDGSLEQDRSADAPPSGHPSDTVRFDAPLDSEHPSSEDAPPDGHPSPPETTSMSDGFVRSQLGLVNGLVDSAQKGFSE